MRQIRKGLVPPPCPCESCSDTTDCFVPTPKDTISSQLPENDKPAYYDHMTIQDMRAAKDFLFAPDEFQKIDSAKRLQNEHVFELAKKYYKPKKLL